MPRAAHGGEKVYFIHEKSELEIRQGRDISHLLMEVDGLRCSQADARKLLRGMERRVGQLEEDARRAERREEALRAALADVQAVCLSMQSALAAVNAAPRGGVVREGGLQEGLPHNDSSPQGRGAAALYTPKSACVTPPAAAPGAACFLTPAGSAPGARGSLDPVTPPCADETPCKLETADTPSSPSPTPCVAAEGASPLPGSSPVTVLDAAQVPSGKVAEMVVDESPGSTQGATSHCNSADANLLTESPQRSTDTSSSQAKHAQTPGGAVEARCPSEGADVPVENAADSRKGDKDEGRDGYQLLLTPEDSVTTRSEHSGLSDTARGAQAEKGREGAPAVAGGLLPAVTVEECEPAAAEQLLRENIFNPKLGLNRNGTARPRLAGLDEGRVGRVALAVSVAGEARGWALVDSRGKDIWGNSQWTIRVVGIVPDFRTPPSVLFSALVEGIADRCGAKAGYAGAEFLATTQPQDCPEMAAYFRAFIPGGCHKHGDDGVWVRFSERELRQALEKHKAERALAEGGEIKAGTPFERAAIRAKHNWTSFPVQAQERLYALYKQATAGDAPANAANFPQRWAVWAQQRGKPREQAAREYAELVERHAPSPAPPPAQPCVDLPLRVADRRGVVLLFEPAPPGVAYTPEGSTERRPPSRTIMWDPAMARLRMDDIEKDVCLVQDAGMPALLQQLRALFDSSGVAHNLP
eukprot:TRINITY_DN8628_c1_g2_i2.p1 TRINITY_DN8628_c1_g2~~TRINITY_DN8628_c1_g2_i2.p1  ORF type:complete len:727 (+),score=207.14 TRINITY_DN8628_c1_g2_i2:83-2182(+)